MPDAAEHAARRERERLFGEVLPETTRDEREPGEGDDRDEELRRNIPPHHG